MPSVHCRQLVHDLLIAIQTVLVNLLSTTWLPVTLLLAILISCHRIKVQLASHWFAALAFSRACLVLLDGRLEASAASAVLGA